MTESMDPGTEILRVSTAHAAQAWNGYTGRDGRNLPNPVHRFIEKISVSEGGCWVWSGTKSNVGYGLFSFGGHYRLAHRWSYENFVRKIGPGLVIDHLCRNKLCVNPQHLEAVTQSVNVLRGRAPALLGHRQKSKTHCPHGHPYSGDNLYVTPKVGGRQCRTCAASRRKVYEEKKRVK